MDREDVSIMAHGKLFGPSAPVGSGNEPPIQDCKIWASVSPTPKSFVSLSWTANLTILRPAIWRSYRKTYNFCGRYRMIHIATQFCDNRNLSH